MTRSDAILASGILLFAVMCFPLALAFGLGAGPTVLISGPTGETHVAPDADGLYHVQGHLGEVIFEAHEGKIRCVSSECSDGVCVGAGAVAPGRPVICAPNGVAAVMSTQGARELRAGLDAVSR